MAKQPIIDMEKSIIRLAVFAVIDVYLSRSL